MILTFIFFKYIFSKIYFISEFFSFVKPDHKIFKKHDFSMEIILHLLFTEFFVTAVVVMSAII